MAKYFLNPTPYELWSRLLQGGYIGDYIVEYCRGSVLRGALSVKTIALISGSALIVVLYVIFYNIALFKETLSPKSLNPKP